MRLILEPHADDCALFCAYATFPERTTIVTVLGRSEVQGQDSELRLDEAEEAARILQSGYQSWDISDRSPDWQLVEAKMRVIDSEFDWDDVFAPMPEHGGHEQHDRVGGLAGSIFGQRCRFYATYKRGSARTQTENEVIPEDGWRARKMRAMSCYSSQIDLDNTRPWFQSDDYLREWVA